MPQDLVGLLREYRTKPVKFVREVFGVKPTKQQCKVLRKIAVRGAHVSVASGHGTGKSCLLAWTVLWFVSCFSDCKVAATAPSKHQLVDVLWAEIEKWHQQMNLWFKEQIEVKSESVHIKGVKNRFAVARTSRVEKPEALSGFHATNMLFMVDEASGVPDQIFETARGAMSTPGARIIMTSNPTRNTGYFYQSHHRNRKRWVRITLSCRDTLLSKGGLVADSYVTDAEEEYGEDSDFVRIRVDGKFPAKGSVQLIARKEAEAAARRKIHPSQYRHMPKVLGVDVAWEGDDRSSVYLRQGIASQCLGVWNEIDNMRLAGLVAQYEDEHQTDATFIDIGWGAGVIDRLRQMGRKPIKVAFGGEPMDKERYINKRTEMWCDMQRWLKEGGVIPDLEDLVEDLVGPEYSFSPKGRIQLERKKDMKKRGLASPDQGDALALTFAAPVHAIRHPGDGFYEDTVMAQTEYDVTDFFRDDE